MCGSKSRSAALPSVIGNLPRVMLHEGTSGIVNGHAEQMCTLGIFTSYVNALTIMIICSVNLKRGLFVGFQGQSTFEYHLMQHFVSSSNAIL